MFTVAKKDLQTYWIVRDNTVEECIGEPLIWASCFATCDEAKAEVLNKANSYLKDLESVSRSWSTQLFRLESLVYPPFRKSLQRFNNKLKEARQRTEVEITVIELPDIIQVKGERIPIGATVYEVDSYSKTINPVKVVKEVIVYSEYNISGNNAYYSFDNGKGVKATLDSGYSNIEFYTDKEQAFSRVRNLLLDEIKRLHDRVNSLE